MSGSITISIELELGWGIHDKAVYDRFSNYRKKEGIYLQKLLDICDKNAIQLTFNVVGKLLTDGQLPSVERSLYPDEWWNEYDAAIEDQKELFHAPDLVQAIRDADMNHEFAVHTYSHVMVDEVSSECVRHEFSQIKQLFDEWGIDQPQSFVAPRHRSINRDILNENGIQVIRTPDPEQKKPNTAISAWMLYRSHPIKEPKIEHGILKTYSPSYPSLTYSGALPKGQLIADRYFQYIPEGLLQRRQGYYLKQAVRKARDQDSHAHLWTHVWDMSNAAQWKPIETFIEWLGDQSETDNVSVHRMKDLYDVYDKGQS